ncbi:MAG TPA: MFS transporter [Dehalococcoidia bacterium]|nr:MFS transporter [Dehalococcoidia bacterium]
MTVEATPARKARFFYGWWVVFASATIVFFTGGTFFYGFGALIHPLEAEFGWSRAAISAAFSLRTEVGGVAAPAVGYLTDRIGARKMITGGVVIVAIGFVLLSQVESLAVFYASIVVIAVGISSSSTATGSVAIAHWFSRRRGLALGMLTIGGGVSGATVLILTGLIDWLGWRDALLACGIAQLVISLPLAISIRNCPEDMGLRPDGAEREETAAGQRSAAMSEMSAGLTSRQALKSAAFWQLAIALGVGSFATTSMFVHIVPFLTGSVHMSSGSAAVAATVMTTLTLVGRLGFGHLTDIYPKGLVTSVGYALIAISFVLLATVHEPWQLVYTMPVFALGFGGIIPARASIQVEYFGLKAFGSIQGLMLTVSTVGGVAGPILAGWLYDRTESYRLAFVLLGAVCAIAVPLMLMARPPRLQPEGSTA